MVVKIKSTELKRYKRNMEKLGSKKGVASVRSFIFEDTKLRATLFKDFVIPRTPEADLDNYPYIRWTRKNLDYWIDKRVGDFGRMKKSWKIKQDKYGPYAGVDGAISVAVVNEAKKRGNNGRSGYYASYVNDGFPQSGGYVWQIGKGVKTRFVEGCHFLEDAEKDFTHSALGSLRSVAEELTWFIEARLFK